MVGQTEKKKPQSNREKTVTVFDRFFCGLTCFLWFVVFCGLTVVFCVCFLLFDRGYFVV